MMINNISHLPSLIVARVPQFSLIYNVADLSLLHKPFFDVSDVLSRLTEQTFFNIGETIIAYQYGQPHSSRISPLKVQLECVEPTPNSSLGLSSKMVKEYFKIVHSVPFVRPHLASENKQQILKQVPPGYIFPQPGYL
jgi:hypothetical protein